VVAVASPDAAISCSSCYPNWRSRRGKHRGDDTAADRTHAMAEVNGRFLIDGQFDTASVVLD
jgi:hypothetical protein